MDLPSCEAYERSYMHRDIISHVIITETQFLVTCSIDGYVKFWKKTLNGIEFARQYKCHNGPVQYVAATISGSELASISLKDKLINIFDVQNCDMINFIKLEFEPRVLEWIETGPIRDKHLAISDNQTQKIFIFDSRQSISQPVRTLDSIHDNPVSVMRFNSKHKLIVSIDESGLIEYWHNASKDFQIVEQPNIAFESKLDTDLYEFVSDDGFNQITVFDLTMSPCKNFFATISSDRKMRIFDIKHGKIVCCLDESLDRLSQLHNENNIMNPIDFLRKMTIERDLETTPYYSRQSILFDRSGNFLIYPSMQGVKVVDWRKKEVVKVYGRQESLRPLALALFQGIITETFTKKVALESRVNDDPTLFCSAYKKNRFYYFSNRNFDEHPCHDTEESSGRNQAVIKDRDIFNEPPTKEEVLAAVEIEQSQTLLFENATIHTTHGDIYLKLFPNLAPKAVENFCVHSKNGYYNGNIFHRVIKGFMIQTGDPTATGAGGDSIWNEPFEDEYTDKLSFDEPFMLAMANINLPNTNGSQFFITVVPCLFLANKHTIFGKVFRGMDVCQSINKVRTDGETEKPLADIKIINIRVY